jgi:hypothetical protein
LCFSTMMGILSGCFFMMSVVSFFRLESGNWFLYVMYGVVIKI